MVTEYLCMVFVKQRNKYLKINNNKNKFTRTKPTKFVDGI